MRVEITVIFDTVCPWCYVGKRRLEAALRLRPELDVQQRWRPFLLNPEMPSDGMERNTYLTRKFGTESRVRRVYGAIGNAGQSVEIDFAFDRIRHTPNSVNSHRLVRFAERHGKSDAAVESLFQHYFVNGKNIGEIDVLLKIGAELGLSEPDLTSYLTGDEDADLIYNENTHAHRRGINSVPTFVFCGSMAISGAHESQVLARMLDAAVAAAA